MDVPHIKYKSYEQCIVQCFLYHSDHDCLSLETHVIVFNFDLKSLRPNFFLGILSFFYLISFIFLTLLFFREYILIFSFMSIIDL